MGSRMLNLAAFFVFGLAPVQASAAQTDVKWSQFKLTSYGADQNVTIPANIRVLYDGNGTERIKKLTVLGGFKCDDAGSELRVEAILVKGTSGSFECGTELTPRVAPFRILFTEGAMISAAETVCSGGSGSDHAHDIMGQPFVVICGARMTLKGSTGTILDTQWGYTYSRLWTTLQSSAPSGTNTLALSQKVDWPVGAEIVVTSSSFNHLETEIATITSTQLIDGKTSLVLRAPLKYRHYGGQETVGTKILNESSEVALLKRSISIEGTPVTSGKNSLNGNPIQGSAHLMFMNTPGLVQVDGVEFKSMGRTGEMGRYPIHWHMVGSVPGHHIKNSVIRNSLSRCVTVHRTNQVQVINNVCVNHLGHGYFLEDGNEVANEFIHNLGVLSRKVPLGSNLLYSDSASDAVSRYAPPGTFWISNPNNIFRGNVAAGSDGSGFWFAFKDEDHKLDVMVAAGTPAPSVTALGIFEDNRAHSSRHGFSLDGGPNGTCSLENGLSNPRNSSCTDDPPNYRTGDVQTAMSNYQPPIPAIMKRVTAYKCREYGFWHRGRGNSVIDDSLFADNLVALGLVFDTKLRNSVVVGKSGNFDPSEIPQMANGPNPEKVLTGVVIYDGPFMLENVQFVNFPKNLVFDTVDLKPRVFRLTVAASNRGTVNQVKGLSFTNVATYGDFQHDLGHWSQDNWAAALLDLDGSLTGLPDTSVVPNLPYLKTPLCTKNGKLENAWLCPGRFGLIFIGSGQIQFDLFRWGVDGQRGEFLFPEQAGSTPYTNHQFSFPISRTQLDMVTMLVREDSDLASYSPILGVDWVQLNEVSPVIEIAQMGHECKLHGASRLESEGGGVRLLYPASKEIYADSIRIQLIGMNPKSYGWTGTMNSSFRFDPIQGNTDSARLSCREYVPSQVEAESPLFKRSGCWYPQDGLIVGCNTAPWRFETLVSKSQITLIASPGPNRGLAHITVDGAPVDDVNLYAPAYTGSAAFPLKRNGQILSLPAGTHRVVIEKTTSIDDGYVVIDRVESH